MYFLTDQTGYMQQDIHTKVVKAHLYIYSEAQTNVLFKYMLEQCR